MNYILYGTEEYLIKKELKKIIDEKHIDNSDISYFDLEEDLLANVLNDASTYSLFSNNRLIVVENSNIFTGSTKKKQDTTCLEKYLNSDNSNTIVFIVNNEKLDSRKKIVTLFKEKGNVIELNKYDIYKEVKEMIKPYYINNEDLNYLIKRVGNNLNILNQEINKLKIYKDEDLNIIKKDIDEVTTETIDIDIFHLVENIVLKNKKEAIKSYNEMLKNGEEPIKILVILANQIRLIYQVKQLAKKRNNVYDMMNILGQKKYPIEKALEKAKRFDDIELLENLYKLAELDINIKSGKINKNIGLELFILSM